MFLCVSEALLHSVVFVTLTWTFQRRSTWGKHPSKNTYGNPVSVPRSGRCGSETVKKSAEIRRNTQKYAEIPKQTPLSIRRNTQAKTPLSIRRNTQAKTPLSIRRNTQKYAETPYQYAEIPKQKHPKQKPYRAWGSKIGRKNRELNRPVHFSKKLDK